MTPPASAPSSRGREAEAGIQGHRSVRTRKSGVHGFRARLGRPGMTVERTRSPDAIVLPLRGAGARWRSVRVAKHRHAAAKARPIPSPPSAPPPPRSASPRRAARSSPCGSHTGSPGRARWTRWPWRRPPSSSSRRGRPACRSRRRQRTRPTRPRICPRTDLRPSARRRTGRRTHPPPAPRRRTSSWPPPARRSRRTFSQNSRVPRPGRPPRGPGASARGRPILAGATRRARGPAIPAGPGSTSWRRSAPPPPGSA
ncbi:hypothetical protein NBEOAGPD_3747 [Methylobacterium gregans]|uniref:Uncharacterized protein n=1 Tax=Methylobacterium gregans TaxID=374424 RepID=A0AA37ME15_9HYPH|nr:hypothetical protein NBEOAGPD_3747 [Methylobacterium gregans]